MRNDPITAAVRWYALALVALWKRGELWWMRSNPWPRRGLYWHLAQIRTRRYWLKARMLILCARMALDDLYIRLVLYFWLDWADE